MNDAGGVEGKILGDLSPRVLAVTVRRFGDFAAAEDAVQEALFAASRRWPRDGLPENPFSWLVAVASRRMIDLRRSEASRRRREVEWAALEGPHTEALSARGEESRDDSLALLFMCCHPALTPASAVALTLRAVGGLTTSEIASAFFVPEATMAQRISRAKQRITESGISFAEPTGKERKERLASVLRVLYLIFNEGYTCSRGNELHRVDLSREAVRLARAVRDSLPEDGEVAGLLALMLLTEARRPGRSGRNGELVPLDKQDRSLWDREAIAEGTALIDGALASGSIGLYQIQAAIAAIHDAALRPEDTDWPQILALYGLLCRISDNPMIALNRAIAAAMVRGPDEGLGMIARLETDKRLAGNHRLDAVRAHLHEMAGEDDAAISGYLAAAGRTASIPERDYLYGRAARLREGRADTAKPSRHR